MRLACLLVTACAVTAATHAQPDPALEYGGPPPATCTGAHLVRAHLQACKCTGTHQDPMRAGVKCADAFYNRDLDGLVVARLDAPRSVRRGEPATLHLVFHNASAESLPLVTSGFATVTIFDRDGRDVTYTGECRSGYSAAGEDYLVTLTAGGELDVELAWRAVAHDGCTGADAPLPAGAYRVVVSTSQVHDLPRAQATVAAPIDITD